MSQNKKKLQIGLDIGVTSVGWSVLETNDEQVKIINSGVRLFSDVAEEKTGKLNNEKRRSKRSSRRIISRRKNRKEAVIKLLVKYNILNSLEESKKYIDKIDITKFGYEIPAQLKCEGLKQKFKSLYKEKLIFCLYNYVSHRGFSFEEYDENSSSSKLNPKASQIEKDIFDLTHSNKFPSEMIVEFFSKYNYYKNSGIQNVHTEQWKKEVKAFCEKQELNSDFINEYLKLFDSYDYSVGPNVKMHSDPTKVVSNPSQYGLYNPENPNVFYNTLWEKTTGRCSFYPNEYRGAKTSVLGEVFNLLNDLANFYYEGYLENKLNSEQRITIIQSIKKTPKKGLTLESILKPIFDKEEIQKILSSTKCGLKLKFDSKNENSIPILSSCTNYCTILNYLVENNLIEINDNFNFLDVELLNKLNKISDIYFKFKSKEQIETELNLFFKENFNGAKINFVENNIPKLSGVSQTHSLSYKAMNEYINYWLSCKDDKVFNWQQYQIEEIQHREPINSVSKNKKYISKDFIKNMIISPSTKRAFNQTINVLNSIIKNYVNKYDIEHITIELARDKNSAEQRKRIDKVNKRNESAVNSIVENNPEFKNRELSNTQKLKMKLWDEQDRHDIYTGEYISPENILNGNLLDIDHIIPISINNDDSYNNKVLCYKSNNKEKLNRTPYEWLSSKGNFEEFKTRVLNNSKFSKVKKENLLNTDVMSVGGGFVARQLVDTRYACVAVKETLEDFFNNNEFYQVKPVINNVRGAITSYFRKVLNTPILEKDRDEFKHHAVDASIIAYLGSDYQMKQRISFAESYFKQTYINYDNNGERIIINKYTGEVIDFNDANYMNLNKNPKLFSFKKELTKRIENNEFHFSRMLETKNNVEISNETIYSAKWNQDPEKTNNAICQKFVNINLIESKLEDLEKYFGNKANLENLENLLCYKTDHKLYNDLNNIFKNNYFGNSNPFINYMLSNYEYLDKTNIKFIQIDRFRRVSKLKILSAEKNNQNVIFLKKHNTDKNNLNIPILDTLNSIYSRIYKNKDGKYIACPINILISKYNPIKQKLEIDENKLKSFLERNKIIDNMRFVSFKKGTTLIEKKTGKIFYYIGCALDGRISLKRIDIQADRIQKTPNKIINDFQLCDIPLTNGKIKIKDWNL